MKKSHLRTGLIRIAAAAAYVAVALAIWHYSVIWFVIPNYILPTPVSVIQSTLTHPQFYLMHTGVTATEAFLGGVLGFALGFTMALVLRYGGVIGRVAEPLVIASQVFPKEALAPVFLVLLGFGLAPKVLIASLICFFPAVVAVERGLRETPDNAERLLRVLGATPWQRFWRCQLPYAAPHIFSSLRICATLSVIGAVVGEFVGASAGLGYVVRAASGEIAMDRVYAALLLLGALGGLFYGGAIAIERLGFPRLSMALRSN
jgi:NitT/TauT family transport system permease protein